MAKRKFGTDEEGEDGLTDGLTDTEHRPFKSYTSPPTSSINTHIACKLPPTCSSNPVYFKNQDLFEAHYQTQHTNVCSACSKNFPNERLLDIHITENHDPFIKSRLEKGESIYKCFVNECERVFSTHKKRRLHLIDKHDYPKNFLFSVVDRGINPSEPSLIKK